MLSRLIAKLLNGHQRQGEPSLAWLPAYDKHKKSRRKSLPADTWLKPKAYPSLRGLIMPLCLTVAAGYLGVYSAYHLKGPARLYVATSQPSSNQAVRTDPSVMLSRSSSIPIKIGLASNFISPSAKPSNQVTIVPPPAPKTLPRSIPVRLVIPKVEIDTSVVPVGLQPTGSVNLPDSFEKVGWYSGGPTPGELGPAIMVGHVDSIHGIAIFWRLRELVPGDTFEVFRADGTIANFKVLEVQQFFQDTFPTTGVYGNIRYAGIRLITCGGTFNLATRHYDQNTVVYAALE